MRASAFGLQASGFGKRGMNQSNSFVNGKPARRAEENVVAGMSVTMEIQVTDRKLTIERQRLNPE